MRKVIIDNGVTTCSIPLQFLQTTALLLPALRRVRIYLHPCPTAGTGYQEPHPDYTGRHNEHPYQDCSKRLTENL